MSSERIGRSRRRSANSRGGIALKMIMTLERFTEILETCGAQAERWPAEERMAAENFLVNEADAQRLHGEYLQVESYLNGLPVPPLPGFEQRLLKSLRSMTQDSFLDRALEWLLPHSDRILGWVWRPALLACLPIVCGIYLANFYSFGVMETPNPLHEELYLLALNDYAEIAE
jgi:hypothetical protein